MIITFFIGALALGMGEAEPPRPPRVLEPGWKIELVAAEPDLVTPVGVCVDARGRVIVVESHTHFPQEDYAGPKADRLRVFEDADGDGRFERIETLYEGTRHTMSVAAERDGSLLVATRAEVFRLRRGADGSVVAREPLARLETAGDYPHNGLAGFAFDIDGSIYFGMGENLGLPYTLVGQDRSRFQGGGEGGNVFRIRPDGTRVERVATGFWNPFHVALDRFGRLYAVDNDPDSRPPCRLIEVVEGGDYGFKFRNGRRGLHPFTSWNGEIPGTLPMISGTGEAPSGMLAVGRPNDAPAFLITSWGDHSVERYELAPRGASFGAKRTPLLQGDIHFRPVGIAQALDGSILITDWVDRSYNVHGKGRLWRLKSAAAEAENLNAELATMQSMVSGADGSDRLARLVTDADEPLGTRALALRLLGAVAGQAAKLDALVSTLPPDLIAVCLRVGAPVPLAVLERLAGGTQPPEVRREALRRLSGPECTALIQEALDSEDPFIRQAARQSAERVVAPATLAAWSETGSNRVRAESLVVLRRLDPQGWREPLSRALGASDPNIRLVAVQWVVETGRYDLIDQVRAGMTAGPLSDRLFAAYQVVLQQAAQPNKSYDYENASAGVLLELAENAALPAELRVRAIRALGDGLSEAEVSRLLELLDAGDFVLSFEAMRALAALRVERATALLLGIAADGGAELNLRADAVAGLAAEVAEQRTVLARLLESDQSVLRRQAARGLRGVELSEAERAAVTRHGLSGIVDPAATAWDTRDALQLAAQAGDPAEGRRVFFHPRGPGCYRCHRVEGRGGRVGPDLADFGKEAGRERVVRALLEPSQEVSPQYTAWQVALKDGTIQTGQMMGEQGAYILLADSSGTTQRILKEQIEAQLPLDISIMPQNLPALMTAEEFRDLVAYLLDPGSAQANSEQKNP